MVWVKIDDSILDNPKIIRSGPIGFALHTAAITWCARNLTDGFLPQAKAKQLLSKTWTDPADEDGKETIWELHAGSGYCIRDADEVLSGVILLLVHVGLWHEGADQYGNLGYQLNDFTEFNPTRAEVLHKRSVRAEAGKAGGKQTQSKRQAKPKAKAQAKPKQAEQQNSTPVPDPDPVPKEEEEEPPPPHDGSFAMHNGWKPSEQIWQSFDVALIPRWASEAMVSAHRSHFVANATDARTEAEWNQSCSKWVHGDWSNPKKRPKKPDPDQSAEPYGPSSEWAT